jgi:predicted AAA+ superfamily ATPase
VYQRFVRQRLAAALADTPVVFLVGPRRAGKTGTVALNTASAAKYDWARLVYFDHEPGRRAAARLLTRDDQHRAHAEDQPSQPRFTTHLNN